MFRLTALIALVAAFLFAAAAPPAAADTYDKLTYLTFNRPVQIPGTTLDPGTYRFHLTNPETSRNVLQVLSHDGETVYAMFHTIPDWRAEVTDDSVVTFKEVAEGVPPPIHSLFYGGESLGYEFVYDGWVTFVPERPQPPITYFSAPEPIVPEPVVAPAPMPEPTPEPIIETAPEPIAEPEPAELPRTGTLLPVSALAGFVSVLAGIGLAFIRRRDR